VFSSPLPKNGVVWICHIYDIKGDVFSAGVHGSAEGYWERDCSDWFDSFTVEAVEGLRCLFELLLVEAHFIEGCWEKDFGLVAVVSKDFGYILSVDADCNNHGISMWE
jgi:hypothetical protein